MASNALPHGIYDDLITVALNELLGQLAPSRRPRREQLDVVDAPSRLGDYVGRLVTASLAAVPQSDRADVARQLIGDIMSLLGDVTKGSLIGQELVDPPEVLSAVERLLPDGTVRAIERPLTPLRDSTVLVNAKGEPALLHELRGEIPSAHRIDILMAFVRWSGVRHLAERLARHISEGGAVRLLTTTYTNSTERLALDKLSDLGVDVRVSYDTSTTRLHAKAWIFHRALGKSTAYVGSSNLTHSAMTPGLEWNVRLSAVRNPDVVDRMSAIFETYWANPDFEPFVAEEFDQRTATSTATATLSYIPPTELLLRPFQERLLDQVALARQSGQHANLLVAATGTGKTVMAAVDYRRLRQQLDHSRLLFVAHRAEILQQSLATFRHALRDSSFGELWVGSHQPKQFEHVFASIQTLTANDVESIESNYFDIVIVDEFHHAAAPTYQRLLARLQPRELLGLTATPERSDGLDLLGIFGGRIAAELRVWDAIDQQYLVPFAYFGIHDGADLRDVPFKRGFGYDPEALTNVYTANQYWVGQVISEASKRIGDLGSMRALGFCVSIRHAEFMSEQFNKHGIPAAAVSGTTPDDERRQVLLDLQAGTLAVVFAVDLFNEGVDVPQVDTLLMLRPTESATLFLQQLGRGLRRADGKSVCTVLDFVGTHRKEFRFDLRYRALLGGSRKDLEQQVQQEFPFLPSGCHLELDAVAQQVVLSSLKSAIPTSVTQRAQELRSVGDVSLSEFLDATGLELDDVYAGNNSWTDLRRRAGFLAQPATPLPNEAEWLRAVGRLLHVDDHERLAAYAALLSGSSNPVAQAPERQRRLARMLVASMFDKTAPSNLPDALAALQANPAVCEELDAVFGVLASNVSHLGPNLDPVGDVPLTLHARYTRREMQAAFGDGDDVLPPMWREGAKWLPNSKTDLLAFTLDKTSGNFSPTTRYRDYAISRELIHWESQSVTSVASPTGQRYVNQATTGTQVMLFARLRQSERHYWFLGPATYVTHEGERPIAITWRLEHPLPVDLFAEFAAVAA